jgi:crotonyl-CoA carboxylase/reductase
MATGPFCGENNMSNPMADSPNKPGLRSVESPDIVPVGKLPPLGVVPQKMYGWAIRPERFGEPKTSFVEEQLAIPEPGPGQVLMQVMAAGVNYNGVWAGLGKPVNVIAGHGGAYHVAGSDASGVIWKVGPGVKNIKVGDEIVVHCNQACGQCHHCQSDTPMACRNQKIWGYETSDGSFAQFCLVQAQQVLPKPPQLTWEEAASYGLTYFTAYRMLVDRARVKPGEDVLIWGAAGGLGVFAVQLCKVLGANAIAMVSSEERGKLCMELGAKGYINRKDVPDFSFRENETEAQKKTRFEGAKALGKKIWDIIGEKKGPDVVFEHVGAQTFPTSVFLANRFGRIVICGATTGYDLNFDVRHLWMHQKSIIGSHFADAGEAHAANKLLVQGRIRPVMTRLFSYEEIPLAHQLMLQNELYGTVSCLVGAPKPGLKNLAETVAAIG